ncbi:TatD family hydrolase [Marinilabiliaceae bacterium ANBcel2]|nr:TatD family hydrolase [Marinilabiliaceae bacterium ANBcel2]
MVPLIDIHNHKSITKKEVISITNNELSHSEPKDLENQFFSSGLHPWYNKTVESINLLNNITSHKNLLAIGECGLDKINGAPLNIQQIILKEHIKISEALQKPLIIHCVGYFNEIIALKKRLNPSQKWIIHGFKGHPQLAKQLSSMDIILSFGEALVKGDYKATASLNIVKEKLFFLETDSSDINIETVYRKASNALKIKEEELKKIINSNFISNFTVK